MSENNQIFHFYNGLLLSPDIDRVRKMLVRYELFKKSLEIPGDIVECGVFKGSGMAYWIKLLEIFSPGAEKKVVGFDLFKNDEELYAEDTDRTGFVKEWIKEKDLYNKVDSVLSRIGNSKRYELVKGPIEKTSKAYIESNSGFRISLLHLDLDVYEGTLAALRNFYPSVVRGGVIAFDEYAIPGWGESDAVDEFLSGHKDIEIKTLTYARNPTAFFIKP